VPELPAFELFHDVLEHERRVRAGVVGMVFAPTDAAFDLFEQTGAALREQAQAVEHAAVALQQAAQLMTRQAELYERAIAALRAPSRVVESAAGVHRR
jgi:hypothetical protein